MAHYRMDNGNAFMRAQRGAYAAAARQAMMQQQYQPYQSQNPYAPYYRPQQGATPGERPEPEDTTGLKLLDEFLTKRRMTMAEKFKQYRKKQIAEMRPYVEGENMALISVGDEDRRAGSPKAGDMIARNPENHADQWLVSAGFFNKNYEPF